MSLPRLTAYLGGSAMLAAALGVYAQYVYLAGFPDGFVSELDRAERHLAVAMVVGSVLAGAYLMGLGSQAARQAVGRRLSVTLALCLLLWLAAVWMDGRYRASLPGGGGF